MSAYNAIKVLGLGNAVIEDDFCSENGFLLKNLAPKHYLQWSLEAGIRYNVGSSIDRDR